MGLISFGMLTSRHRPHRPVDLFALVPQLGLAFDAVLSRLDRLLDDDQIVETVRQDLLRRHARTGSRSRRSTPVEVILQILVVMRLYGWS